MLPFAFWILGTLRERRRLVDAGLAFRAYATCDDRADVSREAYLSAFSFGEDFRQLVESTGSTADFTGACWSPWVWFDIDREDNLDVALADARRLAAFLLDRFSAIDDGELLVFYSGMKGFHIGLPTAFWEPAPTATFNQVARRFAVALANRAGVSIDIGIYDRVRPFRAPNSRHPKTGRHKRRLSNDELMRLALDRLLQLAEEPQPFDVPTPTGRCRLAEADWLDAARDVEQEAAAKAKRCAEANGTPRLNRGTLAFIRDGADEGDRARLLFSAAANLGEFDCPPALAEALLTEAALDSRLPPGEVRRQIECGLKYAKKHGGDGRV
jgi:hypothetical protein